MAVPQPLLPLVLLVGCEPAVGPVDPCVAPATEEVAAMCAIDVAAEVAATGGSTAVEAACAPIGDERWRAECWFRGAESLANAGRLDEAFVSCGRAVGFARMCVGHAAWLGAGLVEGAGPRDADAQAAVDAFVARVPEVGEDGGAGARWSPEEVARAAAWHAVYVGRGVADPIAARGARTEDAALAHTAFAWEATRAIGAATPPIELLEAVAAIWRGERPPPSAAPADAVCLPTRLVPRSAIGYGEYVTIRTAGGGQRFVDPDVEADLRVAVLEARWAAGADLPVEAETALLADPSPAVRRTVARHLATDTRSYPDLGKIPGLDDALLVLARDVRRAQEGGFAVHPMRGVEGRCAR
ncbi:MAG: hypothetical protein FJ090_07455 [Deltaproteobacteria bacterium]|nr:hypothetical protein [Deltaproteobacteria bacterium]